MLCGIILGSSLSKFAFDNKIGSYMLTIPVSVLVYWFIDRLVVMADTNVNAKFIKISRYVIAGVFGLFNSFLLDSYFYKNDIKAEINIEISAAKDDVQAQTDSLKAIHQVRKTKIFSQIESGEKDLKERSNQLVSEVEGSSFSHHVGRGDVYEEKRAAFDRESAEFANKKALLLVDASKEDSAIAQIDREGVKKKGEVTSQVSTGVNHQMELLHKVIFRKPFNILIAFLFLAVCMTLELLPLLAKYYVNISEYFEHAEYHIEAYLSTAGMKKKNMIDQQEFSMNLGSQRARHAEHGRHAIELLRQQSSHNESILDEVTNHIEAVVQKQAEMKSRYPDHYEKYISAIFDRIFNMFTENQAAATKLIETKEEEIPKGA
jgi:hypothetical protein